MHAQSVTINGIVLFTTFTPGSNTSSTCNTANNSGTGTAYNMSIASGFKAFATLTETFVTTGLPSKETVVDTDKLVVTDPNASSSSSSSSSSHQGTKGTCLSGVTVLGNCVDYGSLVKTTWKEADSY